MKTNPLLKQLSAIAKGVVLAQQEEKKKKIEELQKQFEEELEENRKKEVSLIMQNLPERLKNSAKEGQFSYIVLDTTGYCKDGIFYGLHGKSHASSKRPTVELPYLPTVENPKLLIHKSKEEREFILCCELSESLEKALKEAGYPFKTRAITRDFGDDQQENIKTIGYEIIIEWPENS